MIVVLLLALAVAVSYFQEDSSSLAGSTGGNHTSVREPRDYSVFYKSGVFGPTNLRIHVGDTVIFQNFDSHSIRIVSEGYPRKPELDDFDSKKDIPPDGQFSYTFSKTGIFGYYNLINPDESGSVIVRP